MPILEAAAIGATKAIFAYAIGEGGIGAEVRSALGRDPIQKAFARALLRAVQRLEDEHPEARSVLFDASFLSTEGRPVLAQFLTRTGLPDPSDLAFRWAESINIAKKEKRTTYVRELEPPAADFLSYMTDALGSETALRPILDSRALERIATAIAEIGARLGAQEATPGTRRDYLRWLIERNYYLDPRGTYQTQRQVQVKLDDVYISLRGQREDAPGAVDRPLLETELAELRAKLADLSAEEVEDRRELLAGLGSGLPEGPLAERVELSDVVRQHPRIGILGDPGSGKSTLLRYLALKHAEALWNGKEDVGAGLGTPQFPIFVRIAAYAEGGQWKERALSEFLSDHCTNLECPAGGIRSLLTAELEQGGALVLLDGLDEIVSADDRRGVVQQIEAFVRRYENNRFVVSSRIAGYRSAPLAERFVHYVVQEMDDEQIKRFLNHWCPAVEAAQTPDVSADIRTAVARREIDGILRAVYTAPGVRRLAANPLLLRILALIHRTGARLPQKRIELYKLAADTLARTWRTAQGVPESALIRDEYLTRLLGALASWMHAEKPTGIATEREVKDVLGGEWARIKKLTWDSAEPDPSILDETSRFLTAVREHTGLFVERAPRRYGFMHLTFEEYYAARHLVSRRKSSAGLIRKYLYDSRWTEPILLALGFVGLDYPQEAGELFEAAVLAEGEEAQEQNLSPAPYEELLGQDFLFSVRCLGDQIPMDAVVEGRLLDRTARELLTWSGGARFSVYREALNQRIGYFKGSEVATKLTDRMTKISEGLSEEQVIRGTGIFVEFGAGQKAVLRALADGSAAVRARGAFGAWAVPDAPGVVEALLRASRDESQEVRSGAIQALGQARPVRGEFVDTAFRALEDSSDDVRGAASSVLSRYATAGVEGVGARLESIFRASPEGAIRMALAEALLMCGRGDREVVGTLVRSYRRSGRQPIGQRLYVFEYILASAHFDLAELESVVHERESREWLSHDTYITHRSDEGKAAENLLAMSQSRNTAVRWLAVRYAPSILFRSEALARLLHGMLADGDAANRLEAARALARKGDLAAGRVLRALLAGLRDTDSSVRQTAIEGLGALSERGVESVSDALVGAASDKDARVRASAVQQLKANEERVKSVLVGALGDSSMNVVGAAAAKLAEFHVVDDRVLDALKKAFLQAPQWLVRARAARWLGVVGSCDDDTIEHLFRGLLDRDNDVRTACAWALAELARRFKEHSDAIASKLARACDDPDYLPADEIVKRTAQEYAYEGLWRLVAGQTPASVRRRMLSVLGLWS